MTQIDIIKECRFCSEVSKANGEDPIGSAGTYGQFLFVEMPEPWSANAVYEHPQLGVIHKMAKALHQEQGISARVLAIVPDYDSHPNQARILHYQRPTERFAHYEKQEFLIPQEKIIPLATALLKQSDQLSQFEHYRQATSHIRDMMLCTHGSYDLETLSKPYRQLSRIWPISFSRTPTTSISSAWAKRCKSAIWKKL
ncbi:sucrase ferredoxin [Leptolyngbya sp. 7M]|uniref:sucrase ferredoxin n=1 Tax=Leptolyngbya sp. 7M TaxID=2812896 RepID=UPI0029392AA4|nr:sucrase ferredoxin [Leptolyngbya sp. 7M]